MPKAVDDERERREALRAELRVRRSALAPDEVRAASAAVCRHVAALPAFAAARTVALYAATRGEIDPGALAALVRARGGRLAWPRVDGHTLAFHLAEPHALVPDRFEIAAPRPDAPLAGALDVVIVPGVAFDDDGHRLGYGRGFYDAALAAQPAAVRIGLAHAFQRVPRLPRRDGDEPVDFLVTPDGARATHARQEIK